ncbi:MAG: helix-turn-helix transcriptional regulator [Akkermansia sp.]
MKDKKYLPIDTSRIRQNVCYSIEDALDPLLTPDVIEESERLGAETILSSTLMHMRVCSGISQSDMARALGCTQPRISHMESAPNDRITLPVIRKYCSVLSKPFKAELPDGTKIYVPSPRQALQATKRRQNRMSKGGQQIPA